MPIRRWQSGMIFSDDVHQAPTMIATMIIVLVMARAMVIHMGASDCLAIHNVVSTSRGRAMTAIQ